MRVICHLVSIRQRMGKNVVCRIATIFHWVFIKLADSEDRHKILDKLDLSAMWTIGTIVTRPGVSRRLGKCCADDSDFIFSSLEPQAHKVSL